MTSFVSDPYSDFTKIASFFLAVINHKHNSPNCTWRIAVVAHHMLPVARTFDANFHSLIYTNLKLAVCMTFNFTFGAA